MSYPDETKYNWLIFAIIGMVIAFGTSIYIISHLPVNH